MIHINLLPVQKRAKVSNVEKELVLFVLVLIIVGLSMAMTQRWLGSQVNVLEVAKQEKTQEKNRLLKKIKRINEIEKKLQATRTRINVIKQIRAEQSLPVRYLDELVTTLPEDKMWFQSLRLNSNGGIQLNGIALDNQVFAMYVKNLRQSSYVMDVILNRTSRKSFRGLGLVAFQCSIKAGKREETMAVKNKERGKSHG